MNRLSLIVATKDRPDDLQRLLESLRRQTVKPSEILVVDASTEPIESVLAKFPDLSIRYVRHWPPSAAAQRNAGIRASDPASTLVGFADDDTTFEPDAFANMLRFWEATGADVLGAAFNFLNLPARGNTFLKRGALAEWFGLYSSRPGFVSRSGWQAVVGQVAETQYVEWLPSGASVFRREVFEKDVFDEFFRSYTYLEDLDFSYTVSRTGRLAIVADAGFSHFQSSGGRVSWRQFGRYEVRNRLYFVRKHNLSHGRCYAGLFIRMFVSISSGLAHMNSSPLLRALGNIEELINPRSAQPENIPAVLSR